MQLAAQMLSNLCSVNEYTLAQAITTTQSVPQTISFRLVDISVDKNLNPVGRRYMPASGSTLQVTFKNLDEDLEITRAATQPYPTSDPSLWQVAILAADALVGTIDLGLSLLENDITITGGTKAAILSYPRNSSFSVF